MLSWLQPLVASFYCRSLSCQQSPLPKEQLHSYALFWEKRDISRNISPA
jgi:hypothetical protein